MKDKKVEKKGMRRARLVFRKEFRAQVKELLAKGVTREEALKNSVAQAKVKKIQKKQKKLQRPPPACLCCLVCGAALYHHPNYYFYKCDPSHHSIFVVLTAL